MKDNSPLLELIQSLDKGEKRHFKLHSLRYTGAEKSNYIELFDRLEAYKEPAKPTSKTKRLSQEKLQAPATDRHYLTRQIFESLRIYHADTSVDFELRRMLDEIEILSGKNLLGHLKKHLKQAIKLAEETESFNYLLELYDLELNMVRKRGYYNTTAEDIEVLFEKISITAQKLDNLNAYKKLNTQLFFRYNTQGSPKTEESKRQFNEFMNNPLLQDKTGALSNRATYYYFSINSTAAFLLGKSEDAYTYTGMQLNFMHNSPALLKTQTANYLSTLCNYLIDSANNQKFAEGEQLIRHFQQHVKPALPKRSDIEAMLLRSIYSIEFIYKFELAWYDELANEIPALAEKLEKNQHIMDISALLTYYGNFAFVYFMLGDYANALKWTNKILNQNYKNFKIEIVGFMRLLNLVIYYEFGEARLIEYISASVKRYLVKHDAYNEFEQYFINLLKKLVTTPNKKEQAVMLEDLKTKITELKEGGTQLGQVVGSFAFIEWADSKLQRKTMKQIMQERAPKIA